MFNLLKNLQKIKKIDELENRLNSLPETFTKQQIIDLINEKKAIIDPAPYDSIFGKCLDLVENRVSDLGYDLRNQFEKRIDNLEIISEKQVSKVVSALLNVRIASLSLDKSTVVGGETIELKVVLNMPAPVGGCAIFLGSNKSDVHLPQSITVPENQNNTIVKVSTKNVVNQTSVILTAMNNGFTKSITLALKPILIEKVEINPKVVESGDDAEINISLNHPSPQNGTYVWYTSTPSGIGNTKLFIPENLTNYSSKIKTAGVLHKTEVCLNATLNGVTKSTNFILNP